MWKGQGDATSICGGGGGDSSGCGECGKDRGMPQVCVVVVVTVKGVGNVERTGGCHKYVWWWW